MGSYLNKTMRLKSIIITLIGCCVFAIIAGVVASSYPDGLEWVAEKLGFLETSEGKELITAPMPDYIVPAIKNPFISSAVAAILGTVIVFAIAYLIGKIFVKKRKKV